MHYVSALILEAMEERKYTEFWLPKHVCASQG